MAAAASSLRLTLSPLLRKVPYTNSTPIIGNRRRWECFRYCSFSSTPQSYSWQPFRKKKVVMRIAYTGTNYRGLQMQRDQNSLSSMLCFPLLFSHNYGVVPGVQHVSVSELHSMTFIFLNYLILVLCLVYVCLYKCLVGSVCCIIFIYMGSRRKSKNCWESFWSL